MLNWIFHSNDRSNTQAFSLSGFPGILHIFPRFCRFQSSFGMKRPCKCTVQIVIVCLDSAPASWSLSRGSKAATLWGSASGAKSTCCKSKKNSLQKNEPTWHIWNQSWRFFLLEAYHIKRDCVFDVIFVCHFWGDSEVSFKPVLICFTKVR